MESARRNARHSMNLHEHLERKLGKWQASELLHRAHGNPTHADAGDAQMELLNNYLEYCEPLRRGMSTSSNLIETRAIEASLSWPTPTLQTHFPSQLGGSGRQQPSWAPGDIDIADRLEPITRHEDIISELTGNLQLANPGDDFWEELNRRRHLPLLRPFIRDDRIEGGCDVYMRACDETLHVKMPAHEIAKLSAESTADTIKCVATIVADRVARIKEKIASAADAPPPAEAPFIIIIGCGDGSASKRATDGERGVGAGVFFGEAPEPLGLYTSPKGQAVLAPTPPGDEWTLELTPKELELPPMADAIGLPGSASVYDAEVTQDTIFTSWCREVADKVSAFGLVVISVLCTDCQSAFEDQRKVFHHGSARVIGDVNQQELHEATARDRAAIEAHGGFTMKLRCPAHTGDSGNHNGDAVAKAACEAAGSGLVRPSQAFRVIISAADEAPTRTGSRERTLGGWRKVRRALRDRLLRLGARREAAAQRRRLLTAEELEIPLRKLEADLVADDMETDGPLPQQPDAWGLLLLLARKMEFAESSGGWLGSAMRTEAWRSYPIIDYGQIRADGVEKDYREAVLAKHEEPTFWGDIVLQSSRALGGPAGRLLQLSRAGLRLVLKCGQELLKGRSRCPCCGASDTRLDFWHVLHECNGGVDPTVSNAIISELAALVETLWPGADDAPQRQKRGRFTATWSPRPGCWARGSRETRRERALHSIEPNAC